MGLTRVTYYFYILVLCLVFIDPQKSFAQLSAADSTFLNTTATEQVWISYWNYPGRWFIRPEVTSIPNFYAQIENEYPFHTTDYAHCYSSIETSNNLYPDSIINHSIDSLESFTPITLFDLPQPFRVLPFTLNGQTGYARALVDSSHNNGQHQVAYMVILGSGTNLIKGFFDNQTYHNTNCATMNFLKTRGDVFVMTSPNEEQRAIYFNKKKMKSSAMPSFFLSYLNADNRAPGITRLIEYVAMIKYLKANYDRVIVLGLSTGGKVAHWVSLMAEPDAALVSSGYSVLVDNDFNSQNINAIFYGPYQTIYTKDSLKSRLKQVKTQFLFTLPQNDVAISQLDIDSGFTRTFYQDANNASFFYGYTNHAFPPCTNMDTFFTRCILKPKVILLPITTTCTKDSVDLPLHFIGTPPYSFSLYRNGFLVANYNNVNNDTSIRMYQQGDYWLDNLDDAGPQPGYRSDTFHYTPTPALQAQWQLQNYNCLTNKTPASLHIQGASPFTVSGLNNLQSITWTQDTAANFNWLNGQYEQFVIHDSFGCVLSMSDSFQFNFTPISINLSSPIYNCDSNKTQLAVSVQGNAPWVLHYTFNGVSQQTVLTQNNTDLFFNNGLYQFVDVVDSTGCSVAINQSFNFQYQPLSWYLVQQSYNCDSNLYKTEWAFTGNAPWTIQYTINGGPVLNQTFNNASSNWYLPNGQYQLVSINDATSCQQGINISLTLNFVPVGVSLSTPLYNCDSNKTQLAVSVQGNAPWVLHYTFNGVSQQTDLTQNNTDLFFNNGLYQFVDVVDSTGCSVAINQSFNFQYQPLSWNLVQQSYNCDSNLYKTEWAFTGNEPWTIQYTINGGPVLNQTFNNASSNWYLPNGQYQLVSINDATSCQQSINMPLALNFVPVGVSLSTPLYNCDSNKTQLAISVQGNAPWVLHYTFNGASQQTVLTQNNTDLFFINGLYQFLDVVDSTGCSVAINQSFNFQYQPLSWNLMQQSYNCDSNLYKIQWALTGNAPWVLTYELVGGFVYTKTYSTPVADLYLPNGQWHILSISDATGCVQAINIPLNVNFTALSVSPTTPQYDCDSNKMKVAFNIQGNQPFTFQVNQLNNNTTQWLSSSLNNPSFWWPIGQYLIQQVTDATGCVKPINQYINHNILPLSYQALARQFDCDSQKVRYPFVWQGNAPWILSYRDLSNGFVYSKTYNQANASLWLATGQYALLSITDAYCSMPMNDTIIVNFPTLNAQVATPGIHCDSNKAAIVVNLQSGLAPVYLQWVYNGVPDSLLLHAGQQTQLLPNGSYYFNQLRDSTNCVLPINQSYTANYTPLTWNSWQRKYNCTLDTNDITFNINGANNTGLFYTRNGMADTLVLQQGANAVQWGRGQYHLAYLRDTAQCILPIDTTFSINDVPLALDVANQHPICIDKVHEYTFNVKGKAPWIIEYNTLNTTHSIVLNDTVSTWTCMPGLYYFNTISDGNNCNLPFTRKDTLKEFISNKPIITSNYTDISVSPKEFPIQWYLNHNLLDSTTYNKSEIRIITVGDYYAKLIDDAGCIWFSDTINISFNNSISLYPNPCSNYINMMLKDIVDTNWQFQVFNSIGDKIHEQQVETPFLHWPCSHLTPGTYTIKINYQNGQKPTILRFIKL